MIKRLRIKFICINLLSVMSIMLIVLFSLYVFSIRRYRENTDSFMEKELSIYTHRLFIDTSEEGSLMPDMPSPDKRGNLLPSILITLDKDNNIISSITKELYLEDIQIQEIIQKTVNQTRGDLGEYHLRFAKMHDMSYTYMILSDVSFEEENIKQIQLLCIGIFTISLLLFFILSYFFSLWAMKPIEKAWDSQTRFVADASHELKTPLTVILANLSLLGDMPNENMQKWLNNTKIEADRMQTLVANLLFLAKFENKDIALILSKENVSEIVYERLFSFEAIAFEKGVSIITDIQDNLYSLIDRSKLVQVLSILFDNAIKYAGENGQISIHLYKKNHKNIFRISNTGTLLTEDELSRIFDRFYRVDKSRSRKEGGYGLGLSIAKELVLSLKGNLYAKANTRDGNIFVLELPAV